MKSRWLVLFSCAAVLWLSACGQPFSSAPPAAVSESALEAGPSRAQPKLATIRLWIGPKEVQAEQAVTEMEIRTGMMFRKEMGEDEGMLFVFPSPRKASFWMRNTLLPLSCAYIDPNGIVLELHDMKPLDETGIEADSDQVQYVLEMKQGWFRHNKITPGMLVRTERGSLAETYFRRR